MQNLEQVEDATFDVSLSLGMNMNPPNCIYTCHTNVESTRYCNQPLQSILFRISCRLSIKYSHASGTGGVESDEPIGLRGELSQSSLEYLMSSSMVPWVSGI